MVHVKAPTAEAVAEIEVLPAQPVFVASTVSDELKSWSWGSGSVPGTSKGASAMAGPEARIRRGCVPAVPKGPTANPPKMMLPPVPTCARAERLMRRPGFEEAAIVTAAPLLVAEPALFVAT